ncbi:MAG: hypothetical protein AB1735_00705 [Pseudomonadota bacterium]|jgi:hypothetical protein
MAAIGEVPVESTQRRFVSSTAPDGSRWERNSEATLAALLRSTKGSPAHAGIDRGRPCARMMRAG